MLARTRLKLKNAESSIAFLQEQHAKTLEDLHKEIERLQRKSARLTFQLTMTSSKTDSDQVKLEEDLISEIAKLQSGLSKEQEKGALLQHKVDHLLVKHIEDITARDDVIKQLNSELDSKASTVALLTQQLCQTRTRLKQEIEERTQKPATCVCPHCFVHQRMSRSVSAESRLSPLQESDPPSSVSLTNGYNRETLSANSATSSRWRVSPPPQSTPPISPRPPPTPATQTHTIKRRASTPVRRQSPSPKTTQLADASRDHTHHLSRQRSLRPAITAKDTGILSSELQQLLNLKDREVKVSRRRQTHPILPPIASSSNLTEDYEGMDHSSNGTVDRSPSGHFICATLPVSMASDSPQTRHHRRLILAKSKGLSSAPSKLRVLRYSSQSRGGEEVRGGGGGEGEEEGEEGVEASGGSLLMVKETDQKGRSVGPPQWAAAEGDACS